MLGSFADHDWKIVVYNPEAARIFDVQAAEVRNKMTIDELYQPDIAAHFKSVAKADDEIKGMPWKEMDMPLRGFTKPSMGRLGKNSTTPVLDNRCRS